MKRENKKTKKRWHINLKWLIIGGVVMLLALILVIVFVSKDIPNPTKLVSGEYEESSQIFDRNGKLLYEMYSDKRRISVKLTEIPNSLQKATIAIEDANFYKHHGFDFKGIARGLFRTIFQGRKQGGSTLTQQLVKNALLTPERTISRKIKEAVLTVATEVLYSKDQILEMYFNQTPYGGNMWGAQTAAKGIFNKDVKDLDLAESALLAGLPASPTSYSPFSHPEAAKKRQIMVLDKMLAEKFITQEEYNKAKDENLNYYMGSNKILAPHFDFFVKDYLINKYGEEKVNAGGLKVYTTLDLDLQNYVQTEIATEVAKLERYNVTNGAAMITEPKTGQILAMVGSKDYFSNDIDGKYNVTTALRQPGSSIKPLNYAVGLESGKVTAASVFSDSPTCFKVENQEPYCPTNYGGHYYGMQTLRNSLGNSLNIPAVKILKINGLETFVASASAMGLTTLKDPSSYGLSLTLGGGEVKMADMMVAFGVFANMGDRQNLTPIIKVLDKNNKVLEEYNYAPGVRVLSRETSFIIQQILSDDGARSMVFGRGSMLNIKGHPEVAVKTGTTNDLRDNWTIGYTTDYVVATWVGNNDNSKMNGIVSGTTGAAPIWNRVMTYVLKDKAVKKPVMPANIIGMYVCNLTGKLVPESGCDSHYEYFKSGFEPTTSVSLRNNVLIDKDTGQIVAEGENKTNVEWQEHTTIKDASGAWVCLDCPLSTGASGNQGTTIIN